MTPTFCGPELATPPPLLSPCSPTACCALQDRPQARAHPPGNQVKGATSPQPHPCVQSRSNSSSRGVAAAAAAGPARRQVQQQQEMEVAVLWGPLASSSRLARHLVLQVRFALQGPSVCVVM